MPMPSDEYASQSGSERNTHFTRRRIETAWLPDFSTSRLDGQRVRPTDLLVRHSSDTAIHVLAGRALEGRR